jgi:hypothetical protein
MASQHNNDHSVFLLNLKVVLKIGSLYRLLPEGSGGTSFYFFENLREVTLVRRTHLKGEVNIADFCQKISNFRQEINLYCLYKISGFQQIELNLFWERAECDLLSLFI